MNTKQYLTIAEYSEIKGISKQAVYKSLTTKLKPYVVMVEGRKCLKIEVLEGVVDQHVEQPSTNFKSTSFNQVDPSSSMIDFLKDQIKEKDKQIENLQQDVREARVHIQEQSIKLADLLEQSNQLQQNNQMLIKMLGDGSSNQEETIVEGAIVEEDIKEDQKKGLFSKLFR